MENKGSCPSPKEVFDYKNFDMPESRRDLFEVAKGVSEYLIENNINQLVLIDRAARPAHVAIREYWKNVYPDKNIPKIFFINPDGFYHFSEMFGTSQKDTNQKLQSSYPYLITHKEDPLLIFDTCIHSGTTLKPLLFTLKENGFSKVKTCIVHRVPEDAGTLKLIDFEIFQKTPYLRCHPFGQESSFHKYYDSVTSTFSNDKEGIARSKKLRNEIRQIIKEQLKAEPSPKKETQGYRSYLSLIPKDAEEGQTIAESMTPEQILNYLNNTKSQVDNPEKRLEKLLYVEDREFAIKRIKEIAEREFNAAKKYLKQINRLPPEFSQEENKS